METSTRKLDHLLLAAYYPVEHQTSNLFEDIMLVPRSAPEALLDSVDTSVKLFGRRLKAPIIVSAITGGHPISMEVNAAIAEAVEELGLAMGVGSQRGGLENPELVETYRVVRRYAPTATIIANIGAAQLRLLKREDVEKIVEMVEANALAIHLNPAQEIFQPGGDTDFRDLVKRIAEVVDWLDIPVVVKEVGHGLDPYTVKTLRSLGVEYFDVAGVGGTSWVLVEELRARNRGLEQLAEEARLFRSWGLPTAVSLALARWVAPDACIIAGGGVWDGLTAAKAIAFGADAASLALPVLRAFATEGREGVKRFLSRVVDEFRKTMFLVGARNFEELVSAEWMLRGTLKQLLESYGLDANLYKLVARARLYTRRSCGA